MHFMHVISLALAGAMASPAPADAGYANLHKRAQERNHDSIQPIASKWAQDAVGRALKQYQPSLLSVEGCWAFPAVDQDGNWSGGLEPSGGKTGGCSRSTGQTYARGAWHREKFGMMYCWYFPKDQTDSPIPRGHRHDWECAIVWISNPDQPQLQGISTSAHGGWKRWDKVNPWNIRGDAFKVKYFQDIKIVGTHSLDITGDDGGGFAPLIQYELLPAAARNSLNTVDWKSATFMMKDPLFRKNLEAAYPFAKNGPCKQC
ncbi:hypothetical protein LRP88_12926 [Fusarium phalaenopsidis]